MEIKVTPEKTAMALKILRMIFPKKRNSEDLPHPDSDLVVGQDRLSQARYARDMGLTRTRLPEDREDR